MNKKYKYEQEQKKKLNQNKAIQKYKKIPLIWRGRFGWAGSCQGCPAIYGLEYSGRYGAFRE